MKVFLALLKEIKARQDMSVMDVVIIFIKNLLLQHQQDVLTVTAKMLKDIQKQTQNRDAAGGAEPANEQNSTDEK